MSDEQNFLTFPPVDALKSLSNFVVEVKFAPSTYCSLQEKIDLNQLRNTAEQILIAAQLSIEPKESSVVGIGTLQFSICLYTVSTDVVQFYIDTFLFTPLLLPASNKAVLANIWYQSISGRHQTHSCQYGLNNSIKMVAQELVKLCQIPDKTN